MYIIYEYPDKKFQFRQFFYEKMAEKMTPVPLIVDSLQELEIKFTLLNLLITDLRDSVSRAYSRPGVEDCVVPTGVVGLRHA